jgi:D-alanine-D-alanine ligase-like ATP-grasp enzyme
VSAAGSAPVYVTIGWDRASDSIRALHAAVDVRSGLRAAGREALLLSLDRGLDRLLRERRDGVVFPVEEELDGSPFGVRARLHEAAVPVVGNTLAVTRAAGDKWHARQVLAAAGIAVPDAILLRDRSEAGAFDGPRVVKPRIGRGGSVGVHYAADADALRALDAEGLQPGQELLLEEYVPGDEYTVWVFGRAPRPDDLIVLRVLRDDRPILDRASKVAGVRRQPGQPGPAARAFDVPSRLRGPLQRAAAAAHVALGADAYSRVDLIARGDTPVVLEVNAAPRIYEEGPMAVATGQSFTFSAFVTAEVDAARRRLERR